MVFFAAAWLMPLTSEPPEVTLITLSWEGGEAGAAPMGLLVAFFVEEDLRLMEKDLPVVYFI